MSMKRNCLEVNVENGIVVIRVKRSKQYIGKIKIIFARVFKTDSLVVREHEYEYESYFFFCYCWKQI